MTDPSGSDWNQRYRAALESRRLARETAFFGPQPDNPPEWLHRRTVLPFVLRRDRVVIRGDGDDEHLARRTEQAREALRGYVHLSFDGQRLTIRSKSYGRGDWMVPVFVGRVVFTAAGTTIKGVVRPSHMAWPMVALPVVGAGLALLPQASNRILVAALMVLVFVVANNGLVVGRRQARCRRAQVVMALEQIGGAPAQLAS